MLETCSFSRSGTEDPSIMNVGCLSYFRRTIHTSVYSKPKPRKGRADFRNSFRPNSYLINGLMFFGVEFAKSNIDSCLLGLKSLAPGSISAFDSYKTTGP